MPVQLGKNMKPGSSAKLKERRDEALNFRRCELTPQD